MAFHKTREEWVEAGEELVQGYVIFTGLEILDMEEMPRCFTVFSDEAGTAFPFEMTELVMPGCAVIDLLYFAFARLCLNSSVLCNIGGNYTWNLTRCI